MKTRERIGRVKQALETHRAKHGVRESLALARVREAEAVGKRQHPDRKDKLPTERDPDDAAPFGKASSK